MDYSREGTKKRKRQLSPYNNRIKNKIGVTFARVAVAAVLIAGFALVGAGLGMYMGVLKNAPQLDPFAMAPQNYTSIIYNAKTGAEVQRLDNIEDREYVPISVMPKHLTDAFVAIEDERFYSHNGIDVEALGRIVYRLLTTGNTEGASTITQQLIKNKLGRFESTIVSKLQEQYVAIEFEKHLAEPEMYGSKQAAKDYILETYLNTINLGRGCYGVQAAAKHYYGKDVSELTIAESATIAAITQNPRTFPPDTRPEDNSGRATDVLDNMLRNGFITQDEYDEITVYDAEEDMSIIDPAVYKGIVQGENIDLDGSGEVYSYFVEAVIEDVKEDLKDEYALTQSEADNWITNGGLQIFITQDEDIQKILDDAYLNPENFYASDFEIDIEYLLSVQNTITEKTTNYRELKTVKTPEEVDPYIQAFKDDVLTANDIILGERKILTPQPQSSFVIIDYYTGEVKALIGGRGEKTDNLMFNRATMATRSPGSQFKPLASYAPGLDLGLITPATVIDDAPFTYMQPSGTPYTPNNWWGSRFEGLSTVRKGIWRSMNILSVKNYLLNVGIEPAFAYLKNFGFSTLVESETRSNGQTYSDKVPSTALGGLTDGVLLTELCAAYGAIANGGEYNEPIFYTKVLDHDGNVLLENKQEPRRVIKPTTAYLLTDMMEDTVRIGTGVKIAFEEVDMPIAGKTGTTTDEKDLGFSGYTPYYAASIWLGFDQQKKINDDDRHKVLWRKIMEEVHRDLPTKEFERPEGIVSATVCRDSGKLATDLCSRDPRGGRVYTEIFASGTTPTDYCDVHAEVKVCVTSGQRASYSCPEWETEMRVGIIKPRPATDALALAGADSALNTEDPRVGTVGAAAVVDPFAGLNVADLVYDLYSIINGPECEYHTQGILYDENGMPYVDPFFNNPYYNNPYYNNPYSNPYYNDPGASQGGVWIYPPDGSAPYFDTGFGRPTATSTPIGDVDWGFPTATATPPPASTPLPGEVNWDFPLAATPTQPPATLPPAALPTATPLPGEVIVPNIN